MLSFKRGVRPTGARSELVLALHCAETVYREVANADCIVTSINDGRHSRKSLHWQGAAADLRTRHVSSEMAEQVAESLTAALCEDYDVVLESDHIHLEYQPKR